MESPGRVTAPLARLTRHAVVVVQAMGVVAAVAMGGLPSLASPAPGVPLERAALAMEGVGPEARGDPAPPVSIRIGAIDVDADVVALGLEEDGSLEVPDERDDAGWWSGGSAPGAPGPTVIVGHVNLRSGPAVFLRLHELVPGDAVSVRGADGTTVDYLVTNVEQVPKADFPTRRVYGPTRASTLRLITCGGAFRTGDRSYVDNVIVYGELAPTSTSPP